MSNTKTVSAEVFNKHPKAVYDEAKETGRVKIQHTRYPGKIFEIICRNKGEDLPISNNAKLES